MRVGIITLVGDNFGNRLQNYALSRLIQSMGHHSETVIVNNGYDLIGNSKSKNRKYFNPVYISKSIHQRIKNKLHIKNDGDLVKRLHLNQDKDTAEALKIRRREKFKKFNQEYIYFSNETVDADLLKWNTYNQDINEAFDCFVCGSDQVWNRTKGPFFLRFSEESKRIAFAPSFGTDYLPDELKPLYRKWIQEIPYLSIRESSGAKIIKELTGRNVPIIVDPTMCLSMDDWEEVENRPSFIDGSFVVTYFLGNKTYKYRRFIEKYANDSNLKIIDLNDICAPDYYAISPSEYLWLIHHADALFTDSFHGTVFSLIYHTPFVVFERNEIGGGAMNTRIETLLNITGMEQRKYGSISIGDIDEIDFCDSDFAIEKHVNNAKRFLQEAFDEIEVNNEIGKKESVKAIDIKDNNSTISNEYVKSFKHDCTGCSACVNICPTQCISMEIDQEGFSYPKIDNSRCIHCDKCRRVCKESEQECVNGKEKAYVAYAIDDNIRKDSSSGGVFSIIANKIIEKGGSVYGAGFNKKFEVQHFSIDNKENLFAIRGSKYVQSNIGNCFTEIKEKLERGKLVYFSGTPCQVDGLLAFLGREYDNLYTQDIICHGVPSPLVWKEYLQLRSDGERIKSVSFRDKTYGWHYFSMRIETKKRNYVKRLDEDVYIRLFLENIILRPSCFVCHHKHHYRKADFTLADCWGGTNDLNDDDQGISLVFANTIKSQLLFNELKDILRVSEISYNEALAKQDATVKSVPYNQKRELFFKLADENGFKTVIDQWYGWLLPNNIRTHIGYIKYKLRKLIKKR